MKLSTWTILFVMILGLSGMAQDYVQPVYSHDGQKILFTQTDCDGVYYFDKHLDKMYEITSAKSSGYRANWSYDHSKLAFKMIDPEKGQSPVVFDLPGGELIHLAPYALRCGVPFFSRDGKISFSIDHEIYVLNADYTLAHRIDVGHYANLCVLSPNGDRVAYNDQDDQIWLVSLDALSKIQVTKGEGSYFSPLWSPDGEKLLISTMGGEMKLVSMDTMAVVSLDEGENPSWLPDGRTLVYSKKTIREGEMVNMDLYQVECDTLQKKQLTNSPDRFESHCAYDRATQTFLICDQKEGALYTTVSGRLGADAEFSSGLKKLVLPQPIPMSSKRAPIFKTQFQGSRAEDAIKVLSGVPYLHQVYDTPNWYNGHWACGASSATMALTYYKKLAHWDCTVSVPYSHVSHYGRYVCEQYTYSGYTFSSMTTDASGKAAYGGYGYICRNNWADTKGYMAEYLRKHGLRSSVDWSPSWAKLQTEINNGYPMVILNSLTSAGHYILGTGYYTSQHTVVVNDPYGNKNTPGYPSYDGAGTKYDWPGYNNGFKNLNTVHCFIYARK